MLPIQDVAARLGLTLRDLASVPAKGPTIATKASERVSRYEVKDLRGNVVAIHERTDRPNASKVFSWLRPNGGKGLGGRKQNTLPLYGTELLVGLNAATDLVIITEGEKAADALQSIGVLALGREVHGRGRRTAA